MDRIERIGSYRVLDLLAQRTCTEVYAAVAEGPGGYQQQVALKTLRPALVRSPQHVQQFLHEARAAAAVYHPNVVQAHGLLEELDRYVLVMELVRGWTMRALVATLALTRRLVPIDVAVALTRAAASGADALHGAGVLHRNLSPDNLMITAGGHVKVIDFGCATWELTERVRFTPLPELDATYASPQTAIGLKVDRRADVYSLGAILRELVTGAPPSTGEGWPRWKGGAPSNAVRRADVPQALFAAIDRSLRHDPDERFATAAELAEALDDVAAAAGWRTSPASLGAYLASIFTGVVARHPLPRRTALGNMGTTRVKLRRFAR